LSEHYAQSKMVCVVHGGVFWLARGRTKWLKLADKVSQVTVEDAAESQPHRVPARALSRSCAGAYRGKRVVGQRQCMRGPQCPDQLEAAQNG
jgi:hypothetical protein